MKRYFILSALLLIAAFVVTGCSSMSSCFTRNGSRVPISSASTGAAIAEFPVSAPVEQVIYSSPMNQCNPCTPACSNPCDPCSTGTATGANYPGLM